MLNRRNFLKNAGGTGALALMPGLNLSAGTAGQRLQGKTEEAHDDLRISLDGAWSFRTDPDNRGVDKQWFAAGETTPDWEPVRVPHTWQVDARHHDYLG